MSLGNKKTNVKTPKYKVMKTLLEYQMNRVILAISAIMIVGAILASLL